MEETNEERKIRWGIRFKIRKLRKKKDPWKIRKLRKKKDPFKIRKLRKKDINNINSNMINQLVLKIVKKEIKEIKEKEIKEKVEEEKVIEEEVEENVEEEVEEEIEKIEEIKNDNDIFYKKSTKALNDQFNKRRELTLLEILNIDDDYKLTKREREMKANIMKHLKILYPTMRGIRCKLLAGRGNNNDFLFFIFLKNGKIITDKYEFKYGTTNFFKIPQFFSGMCSSETFFKLQDGYIKYYWNNIDDFILCFPKEIQEKLNKYKPKTFDDYRKIVNCITYKHPYLSTIYEYDKQFKSRLNISHRKFIMSQLQDFIKNNINKCQMDLIKTKIMEQDEKYFILCENGNYQINKFEKSVFTIKPKSVRIKADRIIFDCEDGIHQVNCLLRWKNHKGCAMPGWQCKLDKKYIKKRKKRKLCIKNA